MGQNFVNTLLHDLPDGHYVNVWRKDGEESMWCAQASEVNDLLSTDKVKDSDIYISAGTVTEEKSTKQSVKLYDVAARLAFCLDCDFHSQSEKKVRFRLPEDALEFCKTCFPPELTPSFIIFTGHGYQPWWIFNEAWEFETWDEWNKAYDVHHAFYQYAAYQAKERYGVDLDPVYSLNRLMRLPGTKNYKYPKDQKKVRIVESNEKLYSPSDFDEYIYLEGIYRAAIPGQEGSASGFTQNTHNISLSFNQQRPTELIEILCDNCDRFKETWEMRRSDLADTSFSGYDLAIANLCAEFKRSAQEIADIIIAFRRERGKTHDVKKAIRLDYINKTLDKAFQHSNKVLGLKELEDTLSQYSKYEKGEIDEKPASEHTFEQMRGALEIPLQRVVKYMGDEPTYEIHLTNGVRVQVGGIQNLIELKNFRKILASQCNVYLGALKSDQWHVFANLLVRATENVDPGPDAYKSQILVTDICNYVYSVKSVTDWRNAYQAEQPFIKNGRTYIFLGKFLEYQQAVGATNFTLQKAVQILATYNIFTKKQKFFTEEADGKKKQVVKRVYDITPLLNIYSQIVGGSDRRSKDENNEQDNEEEGINDCVTGGPVFD